MRAGILLLLFAVFVAGCSSEDTTPTIPGSEDVVTTSTLAPASTTTTEARMDFEAATLEFTECMREEGIDFPDVRFDAEGRPLLGEILEDVDTAGEEFAGALASCAVILTEAGALDLSTDPELQAVIVDQLAEFSECMRSNGVEAFPDPTPGFSGTGSPYPLGLIPFDDPEMEGAAATCGEQLGEFGLDG